MNYFGIQFTKYVNYLLAGLLLLSAVSEASAQNKEEGEIRIEVKSATKPGAKPETKSAPKQVSRTEANPVTRPESTAEAKPEAKPESKPESKLESKLEPKPKPPAETAPESKPVVKAETEPQARSERKSEARSEPKAETFRVDCDIRPLKGKLDHIPVLNSNSPEIVPDGGILLSTLDPLETKHPEAHLNYAIKGPFDIFFHHINRQDDKSARKVLTISMLVFNPGFSKATLTFNSLASYVSQPDAPVSVLPPLAADDQGKVFAGQGDRVVSDFVRGAAVLDPPFTLNVAPRSFALVTELPIKVYGAVSTLNGRTYYASAQASKPLQFAILASFSPPAHTSSQGSEDFSEMWHPEDAKTNMITIGERGTAGGEASNSERLSALVKIADESGLAGPREGDKRQPTPPRSKDAIVYGRVSGVQIGAKYVASRSVALQPKKDLAVGYPISSLEQGTMGTGEVQAAPLVKRYANSAYAAHGNYCVHYQVDLKLVNKSKNSRFVDIALSTPLKTDKAEKSLAYFKEQDRHVFFRGVIKVIEADGHGKIGKGTYHYYHLVAHRGEKLPPFARFELEAGSNKLVRVELYYTPDATAPQMLTVDSAVI